MLQSVHAQKSPRCKIIVVCRFIGAFKNAHKWASYRYVARRSHGNNVVDEFFAKPSKQIHNPHLYYPYNKTQRPAKPFYMSQLSCNKICKQRLKPLYIQTVYSGNKHLSHIHLVMKLFYKRAFLLVYMLYYFFCKEVFDVIGKVL